MEDKTLKRSPFQTVTEDEPEKEELKRSPFATETLPTLPTTSGFLERLGLTPIEEVLPEEEPAPKRELATSPVIEEVKAGVETEVEQGEIWELRDEVSGMAKEFQTLDDTDVPSGRARDIRKNKLWAYESKADELQTRRTAFKEKTGFTPDEYGRSEKEIKLLREKRINAEFQRRREERAEGTAGITDLGSVSQRLEDAVRDTDEASLLFGPSERRELEGKYALDRDDEARRRTQGISPSAKKVGILNALILPDEWRLLEEYNRAYEHGDSNRPEVLKIVQGVVGAAFEGIPETPLVRPWRAYGRYLDETAEQAVRTYGPNHPLAKAQQVVSGTGKVVTEFGAMMTGKPAGLATIGLGGALAPIARGTGAASVGAKGGLAAMSGTFATSIADHLYQSRFEIRDTLLDPDASLKEKTEAFVGTTMGVVFAFALAKGTRTQLKEIHETLKTDYGVTVRDMKNPTPTELAEAGSKVVTVNARAAARGRGVELPPIEKGDSLLTTLSKVRASELFPKLPRERWSTYFKRVGEQQLRVRLQPEASIHETGPIPPVRGPKPVEIPVERPIPPIIPPEAVPKDPEMRLDAELARDTEVALDAQMAKDAALKERELKFETEAVDLREKAPEGSVERYYDEKGTLQVKPDPETVRFQEVGEVVRGLQEELTVENLSRINREREAKILEAMQKEPAAKAAAEEVKAEVEVDKSAEAVVEAEVRPDSQGKVKGFIADGKFHQSGTHDTASLSVLGKKEWDKLNLAGESTTMALINKGHTLVDNGSKKNSIRFIAKDKEALGKALAYTDANTKGGLKSYSEVDGFLGDAEFKFNVKTKTLSIEGKPDVKLDISGKKPEVEAAVKEVVEDAKVVEATEKVAEEKARIESAAEIASVASRMPDMGGKMKVIVKREIEMLRRDGATAEELGMAAELEADPSSIYEVYPTSEWAHKLTKYTEAELNVLKESMKALESPPEGLMGVLEFSLVDRKYKAWKKAKPEDSVNLEKEYRDALQAWSSEATKRGQWVQAQRYNPHKSPEIEVDAIKARIESSVGGKPLTPKESAELLKLVEKSQDTLREFQEKQREYHRDPTEPTGKVFDEAYELRVKAEAAAREQWEYMRDHEPQLWADIYVSILQGNLLTPATLVLNPVGNIVPLPFRAGSRTAARVVDLIDEFIVSQSPSGKAKLKRLQEELKVYDKSEPAHGEILAEIVKVKAEIKENRTTVHAKRLKLEALREELKGVNKSDPAYIEKVAEIARLEKETLGDIVLQPWSGTGAKIRGFVKGLGADRLAESLNAFRKAPKGGGRAAFMEAFKHRRYSDSLSSLFYGQKVNMYEAGQEFAMTPLSPAKSLARLYGSLSSKEGRLGAEGFVKNLAVGIGGIIPTGVFRALGAGDLPFRQAEMYRVIENYGERFAKSKGWTPKQRDRWIEQARKSPEIAFTEKQLEFFENESAKASFQNDTWATKVLSWANVGMRAPRKKGALRTLGRGVYMGYRTITPYQKTLVNIFGELGGATPLGMVEAANPYLTRGQKKYAIGRAVFGTSVYTLIQVVKQMTNDDGSVISVDYSTGMTKERKASIRYLSYKHQAHGTWNWSAARRLFRTGNSGGTKAGDNITDLQKAGPFGSLMLANAAYGDLMETLPPKERKGVEDNWYKMLASHTAHSGKYLSRYLLNQSFAQNAKDVAQSIAKGDDPQQWLKPLSRALPALAIPNTLDWLYGHSADNRYRTDYSSKDGAVVELKQVWKKKMEAMGWLNAAVKGKLGFESEWSAQADGRNPLIFDMWGQPIDRVREGSTLPRLSLTSLPEMKKVNPESTFERYALSGFGVLASGETPDNPVAKMLWGLWKATRDNEIVPAIPRRDISREGVDYKLNRDQYAVYQRLVGLRRMKGPPLERRAVLSGGSIEYVNEKWSGMANLLKDGDYYQKRQNRGKVTKWEDMKQDEQVKHVLKTYDEARRSAGDYLVDNFMLKKGGPTKEDLIALADLGEDATEKEARAVIKGFSINLDNLDKLEVTEKPSGRLKK